MLDHKDDLDADFLAIYRIDLEDQEVDSVRFFSLAVRLPAYQGVLALRIQSEEENRKKEAEEKIPPNLRGKDVQFTDARSGPMAGLIDFK